MVVFSGSRNKRASKHAFLAKILRPSLKIGWQFWRVGVPKKNRVLSVLIQALLVNADGKIVVNPPDFEIVFVEDVVWMVFGCCRPQDWISQSIQVTGIIYLIHLPSKSHPNEKGW